MRTTVTIIIGCCLGILLFTVIPASACPHCQYEACVFHRCICLPSTDCAIPHSKGDYCVTCGAPPNAPPQDYQAYGDAAAIVQATMMCGGPNFQMHPGHCH